MNRVPVNEEMTSFILDNAPLLYLVADDTGGVVHANRYARGVLGDAVCDLRLAEVFVDLSGRQDFAELLGGDARERILTVNVPGGLPKSYRFTSRRFEMGAVIVGSPDGEESETLLEDLVQANNEVNNLARELHKKNAELKRLNELRNEFLGMAAHDLRTPIGNISTLSEFLLEEGALQGEFEEYAALIHNLSGSMLELLENLLDITAIESGKVKLGIVEMSLAEVVEITVRTQRGAAERKDVRLVYEADPGLPTVQGDPHKLMQVAQNLVTNAIKYTWPGTEVTVTLWPDEGGVLLSVTDQGPGIPEDELGKLFQPFGKTSVRPTGDESSTGLGLAIVRKLVTAHGGRAWADSTVGEGSTFHVFLPTGHMREEHA